MNPRQVLDQKDELQIVDVREPHEWAGGHIEGAHHIPMNDVPNRLAEIDRRTARSSRSAAAAATAAAYLAQAGFTAHNMDGGMATWQRQDLPVQRPEDDPGRSPRSQVAVHQEGTPVIESTRSRSRAWAITQLPRRRRRRRCRHRPPARP